jgi:hypothetical protein
MKDPHVPPPRSGCGPLILVGLALLAGLSALFVPSIIWQRRELAAVERLTEEARRLGGDAGISPGGIDILGTSDRPTRRLAWIGLKR